MRANVERGALTEAFAVWKWSDLPAAPTMVGGSRPAATRLECWGRLVAAQLAAWAPGLVGPPSAARLDR
ncbi:MAG: hypothetical protein ACYCZN_12055 [Candidatus Dormibacteria bacterium]